MSPLYPRKQTLMAREAMSSKGQNSHDNNE
jgi:hypothetical protein